MNFANNASVPQLSTARLILRGWREDDVPAFAEMNANPRVMEFMPGKLLPEQSAEMVDRISRGFTERGFGLWAVEIKESKTFIGFTGLSIPRFEAAFTPCVEVGWRLAYNHWGQGYATEAARAAIRFGFEEKRLEEIVSFTTKANTRSRRVMEKLGMSHDPAEDFDHPSLPADHVIRPHVLYRLSQSQWLQR